MTTKYAIPGDCVICDRRGEEVRLCGDYATALCQEHRNEWKEYAHALDEINDYMRKAGRVELMNKKLAGGRSKVNEDYYLDSQKEAKDAGFKCFLVAKEWVLKAKELHRKEEE